MFDNRPGLTPMECLQRYYRAMNAGQADEALALFAEDAIRLDSAAPEQVIQGKAQIGKGIAARITDHIVIEASDFQVQGNVVTCMAKASTDYGRRLDFAPVAEVVEVTVVNGLITKFIVTVTPESLMRIQAAESR